MRAAVIENMTVVNIIVINKLSDLPGWNLVEITPGMEPVWIGDHYENGVFTHPAPPEAPPQDE